MSAAAPPSGVPAPGTPAPTRPGSGERRTRRPGLPPRLGVLAEVALVPVLGSYAAVVVLAALVTASASGTSPGGQPGLAQALGIGVPLWLAVHLVPLTVSGAPLGMLPLGPAAGVALLVAGLARRGVVRLGALPGVGDDDGPDAGRQDRWSTHGVPVVAAVAAVHAAAGVLAAALLTPDTGSLPAGASPATAGTVAGLLAALAAAAGAAGPCGLGARMRAWPEWLGRGLRAGLGAAVALVAGGATLLLVVLLAHADAVARAFTAIAPDAGSGAGLWLVDAAYLPNAVVAAASWLLGPGYAVGAVTAAPTGATPGLVPPLPLAALLPAGPPPSWAGLAFALPLAVGSAVGWLLAPVGAAAGDLLRRVRPVLVAALTAAVVLALAAGLAGGRLGSGPFDPVVVPAGLVLLATCAWIAVPGAVVALLAVPAGAPPRDSGRAAASSGSADARAEGSGAAPTPGSADDPSDEAGEDASDDGSADGEPGADPEPDPDDDDEAGDERERT